MLFYFNRMTNKCLVPGWPSFARIFLKWFDLFRFIVPETLYIQNFKKIVKAIFEIQIITIYSRIASLKVIYFILENHSDNQYTHGGGEEKKNWKVSFECKIKCEMSKILTKPIYEFEYVCNTSDYENCVAHYARRLLLRLVTCCHYCG